MAKCAQGVGKHAALAALLMVVLVPGIACAASTSKNYVFFNLDREGIRKPAFADNKLFSGAQIKFTWRSLEPSKGVYSFMSIYDDLSYLKKKGKGLFLQIQDVSFVPSIKNVPDYLLNDPSYHGGVDPQYEFSDDADSKAVIQGWVARRWDPKVAERFHLLLKELGKRFDGQVDGITLPETSVDFGSTGKYYPKGFSPDGYVQVIKANMAAAKAAFSRSVFIQYANFMPGEWLPWDDKGYLSAVYSYAKEIGAGAGGPDLIPYRKGQMNHAYHFAKLYAGTIPLGFAVQEGNYSQQNANTGKRMTIQDIYDFATGQLGVNYIFWYPQEPYFSRDLLPFLLKLSS
jgi:hypothetical protein